MPFDMTPNGDGGGGGWNGQDPMTAAMLMIIASLYNAGVRPKNFGPGLDEMINIDIQIKVSPDGKSFALIAARSNRWEQIEVDESEEDDFGD